MDTIDRLPQTGDKGIYPERLVSRGAEKKKSRG